MPTQTLASVSCVTSLNRVTLRFAIICTLFLLAIVWLEPYLGPLNRLSAVLAGNVLTFAGYMPVVTDNLITLEGFSVRVITECTALNSAVLFCAFVLTVSASLKSKLLGLLAGIPFLVTFNTLRIALVTMTGDRFPALFEAVHVYVAQVVTVIVVIAAALSWFRIANRLDYVPAPFLLRAVSLASIIFIPWLALNEAYVKALDHVTTGIFGWAGYRLVIPYQVRIYFQTFNTVLFLALIYADRRLTLSRRTAWAAAGVAVLAAGHLMFRIGNVMLTAFSWWPALPMTMSLTVIGEYLLPPLLWLCAIRTCRTVEEQGS